MADIKVDLICELAAIATMRSEFEVAEQHLAEVVAHTQNFGLFKLFEMRIALHHTHLAYAKGAEDQARTCYEAAIHSSVPGSYIHTSSHARLTSLEIGIAARDWYIAAAAPQPSTPPPDPETTKPDSPLLAARTHSLAPLAHILTSVTQPIVRAKQVKAALDLLSKAQDKDRRAPGIQ
ncbi:hypothetical protein CTheo_7595 [Ceratobasidium theobromae]|uniref:Uncharacterized protein n=1 Tax=Ceratobasidium theobromae TaxID=1582974 RepID=A0A5N5QC14_9AGAM|nr:hypothetical protein CTheo_7595 [Ceratobasidium theobromae]